MKINFNFRKYYVQIQEQFNSNWLYIFSNRIVATCTIISIFIIAISWPRLPQLIPLWYSQPWGQERLAAPVFILLLPVATFLTHLLNILIGAFWANSHRILIQLLFVTSIFISIISLLSVVKIISIVL